jgi:hypothetical protein
VGRLLRARAEFLCVLRPRAPAPAAERLPSRCRAAGVSDRFCQPAGAIRRQAAPWQRQARRPELLNCGCGDLSSRSIPIAPGEYLPELHASSTPRRAPRQHRSHQTPAPCQKRAPRRPCGTAWWRGQRQGSSPGCSCVSARRARGPSCARALLQHSQPPAAGGVPQSPQTPSRPGCRCRARCSRSTSTAAPGGPSGRCGAAAAALASSSRGHAHTARGASRATRPRHTPCHLQTARADGLAGFYRGFGAVLWGVLPANMAYFGGYELGKRLVPADWGLGADMATGAVAQVLGRRRLQ